MTEDRTNEGAPAAGRAAAAARVPAEGEPAEGALAEDTPVAETAAAPAAAGGAPGRIRLYGTVADSIVDGPGLRYAVFVQGCSHGCPGCHNPESHPADGGTLTTIDAVVADIRANGLVHDVTLSGGDPFEQPEACAELARRLKDAGYGLWAYTGYRYEDLLRQAEDADAAGEERPDAAAGRDAADAAAGRDLARAAAVRALLDTVDVLVDGPFVESLKSLELKWRGSSNQRLIDLPATRRAGRVVLWQPASFDLEKPSNW